MKPLATLAALLLLLNPPPAVGELPLPLGGELPLPLGGELPLPLGGELQLPARRAAPQILQVRVVPSHTQVTPGLTFHVALR